MLYYIKKYFSIILILIIIILIFKTAKIYIEPYYNAAFTEYNYKYPKINQKFIVNIEPYDAQIPEFVVNILKLAFYDRELIVNNNMPPHIIVRCENIKDYKQPEKYNAPYITLSGERWTLKRHKYRKNGPPLAEIVSAATKKTRELYFPFMVWSGVAPERQYYAINHRKNFLVYIASNCVKKREKLFRLIKKLNPNAAALGTCSNPNKVGVPGGYGNLDKIYAQYDFGFALENTQTPGYITEKIINVFRGGAIPIYWGDTDTVNKYFNEKAFINIDRFKTLQQAAEYIVNLSPEKIKLMRAEPIFKNNKIPEIFSIVNNPKHPLLQQAATFIRNEYLKKVIIQQ